MNQEHKWFDQIKCDTLSVWDMVCNIGCILAMPLLKLGIIFAFWAIIYSAALLFIAITH
jgi:hypothetical protein